MRGAVLIALAGALAGCAARQDRLRSLPTEVDDADGVVEVDEVDEVDEEARPEPCLDPYDDAERRFAQGANDEDLVGDLFDVEEGEEPFDLDGDGQRDLAIGSSFEGGSGGYTYQVYLRRGACGLWVGALRTTGFVQAATRTNGLADLELSVQAGTANWWERHARFDGQRYQVVEERECRATYGDGSEEPPPDCGPWGPAQLPK